MKWICAALPLAVLGCYNATDTLKAFYQAIASHDCQKAVSLAEGYSIERCQNITRLQLGNVAIVSEQATKTVLKFTVSYQTKSTPELTSSEAVVTVKQVDKVWKVDFASLKTEPEQKTPSVQETKASDDKPEAIAAQPQQQTQAQPQQTPPQPQAPVLPVIPEHSLLALWQPEQLIGRAGDEKIRWQRPDYEPPIRTQPTETLPTLPASYLNSIRRVKLPSDKKWLALTFDLCERADEIAGYDRRIINTLRDKNVKATFFTGGKWMQSHPEQTQQLMADRRFEIGNHAWTHGNLRVLQGEAMQQQIVWTQAEYERQWEILQGRAKTAGLDDVMASVPRQPTTLRFPFGTCSSESLQAVNNLGLSAVQWDVVSGDPGITVKPNKIVEQSRAGSIVVFHANGRGKGTANALPQIIDQLRAKGFELVTVSELLAAGTIEAVDECYELKRGDNLIYDAKYGDGLIQLRKLRQKPKAPPTPAPEPESTTTP